MYCSYSRSWKSLVRMLSVKPKEEPSSLCLCSCDTNNNNNRRGLHPSYGRHDEIQRRLRCGRRNIDELGHSQVTIKNSMVKEWKWRCFIRRREEETGGIVSEVRDIDVARAQLLDCPITEFHKRKYFFLPRHGGGLGWGSKCSPCTSKGSLTLIV